MAEPRKRIAGKYELLEALGQGGMANVWLGVTHGAGGFTRKVAIKRVLPNLADDDRVVAMFVEEARVVSDLQHPNIVQVHDFDRDESGHLFLVMEWIEGLDLSEYLNSFRPPERAPWPLVTAIAIEVLRALSAAHERTDKLGQPAPVYHRDVNPANILCGVHGAVKLADFGMARAMDRAQMTGPGMVKGKIAYLAPEQLTGAPASVRSDLFSLGTVLWESLAGKRLFGGRPPGDVIMRIRAAEVPPLAEERPELPNALVEATHRALAKDPRNRFDSANEMLRALAAVLRAQPVPTDARPLGESFRAAMARLGKKRH